MKKASIKMMKKLDEKKDFLGLSDEKANEKNKKKLRSKRFTKWKKNTLSEEEAEK